MANYACTCTLKHLCNEGKANVCAEFEDANEADTEDCCVHCRHTEACHGQPIVGGDLKRARGLQGRG